MTSRFSTWLVLGASALVAAPAFGEDADTAFFEAKVRPLLIDRCFECHSHEKKIKGGLALDSRIGWSKGGESGPAIEPGEPEKSLLIKAVRRGDPDLAMPPKTKLRPEEVAVLEEWVRRGAPDPRSEVASTSKKVAAMSLAEARHHWSFQPVPKVEAGNDGSAIDRLVRARLEQEGLAPNPQADPRVLVRRVYFDLLGLPPTYEEVEQYAAHPGRERFAALIDRLLARPEYGQRWGRHWLDVARYSDTTEKSVDGERRIPFAHTYRDYVIDAFNADKPFDQFVLEQVAADRMPPWSHPDQRALGFLTVGRRFEGNAEAPQLIIDDRIDLIGRGLLGLTLACARCHDHKFDAIPSADYYSLYGIIASSGEPLDLPEVGSAPQTEAVKKYRKARAEILSDYDKHIDACVTKAKRLLRELAPEYLAYIVETSANHRTVEGFVPLDTPRGLLVRGGAPRWNALIAESLRRGQKFFRLWPELIALPRDGFADRARQVIDAAEAEENDIAVLGALREKAPASMLEVADVFGRLLSERLQSATAADVVDLVNAADSPLQFTHDEVAIDLLRFITEHQLVSRPDGEAAAKLREKLTVLEAAAPVERAMAVAAHTPPFDARVMVRGDRTRLAQPVPRRFLQVLGNVDQRSYADDGRLELAEAIVNPGNPLTPRVIVNRIWQQHFGRGLVATPDNFGAVGERPSHPELLDYLAGWFVAHGWSIKALHRLILNSATWQQSSAVQELAHEKDPGNRLLWRMAPRRLEFEPMRDALLKVAGKLDRRLGGRSALLSDSNNRRAVYGYTDRFRIPALLRNFDVANPDQSISRRAETIHPLQALFFLNSPFVRTQAEAVMHRGEVASAPDASERINRVYQCVLSRNPDAEEQQIAAEYLGLDASDRQWANFVQGFLLSNEFIFCD